MGRLFRRLRWLIPYVAFVVGVSVLVGMPIQAFASPPIPPGATRTAPKAPKSGSASGHAHLVSASKDQVSLVGPHTNQQIKLPKVTGDVGPKIDHSKTVVSGKPGSAGPQTVTALTNVTDAGDPIPPPSGKTVAVTFGPTAATTLGSARPTVTPTGGGQGPREDVSARTPYSTVYHNGDGTSTMRIYDDVAYVPDGHGGYVPVDASLSQRSDGRLHPAAAANVSFANSGNSATLANMDLGGGSSIGYGLSGAAADAAVIDGGAVDYVEVRHMADLDLSATVHGMKESIVLKAATAPRSWLFPLSTVDATPSLAADGSIVFTNSRGVKVGVIPPGFMVDSSMDPHSGAPARSNNVTYTLVNQGGNHWALQVDLDSAWLDVPTRQYPVIVDPTTTNFNPDGDDTFVSSSDYANTNNSASADLLVGTYNGGGEKSASYFHLTAAMAATANKYIVSANFHAYEYWSYSCTAKPVSLYRVTSSWAGSTSKTYPGPSYDPTALYTTNAANGYTSCPTNNWVSWQIPASHFTSWTHGTEAFYGLTMRASTTDSTGWKRFRSEQYSPNGDTSKHPYLDVTYADQGASYSLVGSVFNPPVTPTTDGQNTVKVTNLGSATWTSAANDYRLTFKVLDSGNNVVQTGPLYSMPASVGPAGFANIPITVTHLPLGHYTLQLDMVDPSSNSFHTTYSVPYGTYGFDVANGAPIADAFMPAPGAQISTLTPTLWADYFDPDNSSSVHQYAFRACTGTPGAQTESNCHSSPGTWINSATWTVPPGTFTWGKGGFWTVQVNDTTYSSALYTNYVSPEPDQPEVTSHLSGAPDGSDIANVNTQVGNYTASYTDAQVTVVGPPLAVTRTYNSQDPRTGGMFGAGWSSPWDQHLSFDTDGSGGVVVTLPTGLEARFGLNADGSYGPPNGVNMTLVATGSPITGYTMRDGLGNTRQFDVNGRLTQITDADARSQTYQYDQLGHLSLVTDVASGRALHVNFSGLHVSYVDTDAPAPGQPVSHWTYGYTGAQLTQVCSPQSVNSCTSYGYQAGSFYRSVITDDGPIAYWPLGESGTGAGAANVAASAASTNFDGSYEAGVTVGTTGGVGSADTAATFGPTGAAVDLPDNLVNTTLSSSTELWFKAASGVKGALLTEQSAVMGQTPSTNWFPDLFVGADGKLYGQVPTAVRPGMVAATALVGKCLDDAGSATTEGNHIQISSCTNNSGQQYFQASDSSLRVLGKCVSVAGNGTTSGTLIQLNTCTGATGQIWTFDPATSRYTNPNSGRCLDDPGASTTDGTQLDLWTCNTTNAQKWTAPGYVASLVSGIAGKCADDAASGTADGTHIQVYSCNATGAQQWAYLSDGTLRVFGHCMEVAGSGTTNGSLIQLHGCTGATNQAWIYNGTTGAFTNVNSGKCLDDPGSSSTNGTQLDISTCTGGANQHWAIPLAPTPIGTTATVTDGAWHHVVLSASLDHQELYLDGNLVGSITGRTVEHFDMEHAVVGNGFTAGVPQAVNGYDPFGGSIDEVAFYMHPLSAAQVLTHYTAAVAGNRLATVTEPGNSVAETVGYDNATGRVLTAADRNGATATLSAVTTNGSTRTVTVSSDAHDPVNYTYNLSGQLLSRTDALGTQTYDYDAAGFLRTITDPNGNATTYQNDDRGNVKAKTTCRVAPSNCQTTFYGYYQYVPSAPLDPRNDKPIWQSDGRSADENDTTYRTTYTLDTAGRVTQTTYPKPAGAAQNPTETVTYSQPGAQATPTTNYTMSTASQTFTPADQTVLSLTGDDVTQSVSLPFPMWYYGSTYTSAWVSTDGFIAFTNPGTYDPNSPPRLADPLVPNNDIQVFFDDLIVDGSSTVRTATIGAAPNRQFVVEWRNVHRFGQTDLFNAEAILSENGDVTLNYSGLSTSDTKGAEATVGIEDSAGTHGLEFSHNTAALASNTAVVFTANRLAQPPATTYASSTQTRSYISADTTVLSLTGNNNEAPLTLPFPIPFYGTTYTKAYVSTNGFVSFDDPGHPDPAVRSALPTTAKPYNAVFPFWDDLQEDASSSIRTTTTGTAPNRQFVIEWRNVIRYGASTRFGFEVVFNENGEVSYNYTGLSTSDTKGAQAIVGLEDPQGAHYTQFSAYSASLNSGTAVVMTPSAPIPAGLLLSMTDRNGNKSTRTYNSAGDLVSSVDQVGLVQSFAYDNLGRMTATDTYSMVGGVHTDYGTTSTTYTLNSLIATSTAAPITNTVTGVTHTALTTNSYTDSGLLKRKDVSDLTGGDATRSWQWTYYANGNQNQSIGPDGATTSHTWNNAGDVATTTEPGGLVLTYTYDDAHHLELTTASGVGADPNSPTANLSLQVESRAYDSGGRLYSVIDAMGRETDYTYFGDNLLQKSERKHAPDTNHLDQTVQVEYGSLTYDGAGNVLTTTEVGNILTKYTYDAANNALTQTLDPQDPVTNPNGLNRVETMTYNIDNSLASSTSTGAASPGRSEKTSYTYDNAGRVLTTTVDNTGQTPASLTTTLVRDPRGLVTRSTDPAGQVSDYTYDAAGQPVTTTDPARTIWVAGVQTTGVRPVLTVGRDTFGEVTKMSDPNGAVTSYSFDPAGRVTDTVMPSYTQPGGATISAATTHTHYNSQGLPDQITDPLGRVTTNTYNPYGYVLTKTLPDPDGAGPKTSPVWTYTYDRVGEQTQTVDPSGATSSSLYNDLGQQYSVTQADRYGGTTNYYTSKVDFDSASRPYQTTSPLNEVSTVSYNTASEVTRSTDPTGRYTDTFYDLAGRVVASAAGRNGTYLNPVTTTTYDLAGRPIESDACTVNSSGGCATVLTQSFVSYDADSRPVQSTSAQGRITTIGYDGAGEMTSVGQRKVSSDPNSSINVTLGYDKLGHTSRMVDGNGNATDYTYNVWGLPESTIEPQTTANPNPSDRTWTATYDAAGQQISATLPGGVSQTNTYDLLGRLTDQTGSGAAATTTARHLDYDSLGRTTQANSPAGNLTYTWDDRDLLRASTGPAGNASFSYDGDNNLLSRTDAAGQTNYTYDAAGRLVTLADPLTGVTSTSSYDDAGRLAGQTFGTGNATRTITYDNLSRPYTDVWKKSDLSVISSTTYGFDNDSLLTAKTTAGPSGAGANAYTYDGLGRLSTWLSPGGVTTTYGYDNASNRTTINDPTGTHTTVFDQRNRPVSASGGSLPVESWSYTARGTLSSDTKNSVTTSFTSDAFDRTVSASSSGYTVNYAYDSLDRVASRNSTAFGYADMSNNLVSAPNPSGTTLIVRDPSGTPVASKIATAASQLLLTDLVHDDATATTSASGTLSASTTYDPWGVPTSSSGSLPLGYQGGYTDPNTNEVNAAARWYAPDMGAFTARDSWTLGPNPVAQTNRYLYAAGNPLGGTDPSGHMMVEDGLGAAAPSHKAPAMSSYSSMYAGAAKWNKAHPSCQSQPGCMKMRKATAQAALQAKVDNDPNAIAAQWYAITDRNSHMDPGLVAALSVTDKQRILNPDGSVTTCSGQACLDYASQVATYKGAVEKQEADKAAQQQKEAECAASFWCSHAGIIGDIVGGIAGAIAGIACAAVTAVTVIATAGCGAVAGFITGFVGSIVTDSVSGNDINWTNALVAGGVGAIGGALGGGFAGKLLSGVMKPAGNLLTRVAQGAAIGAVSGAENGFVTGAAGGAIDYLRNCKDDCSFGGFMGATGTGAAKGALAGGLMGGILGGAGGALSRGHSTEEPTAEDEPEPSETQGPGCGGKKSFSPDTAVLMADGNTKPIGRIQPGDEVRTTEPGTGTSTNAAVTATHINRDTDMADVVIGDRNKNAAAAGSASNTVIHTTAHHLFYDETRGAWIPAENLTVGDRLYTPSGATAVVEAVRTWNASTSMDNLSVANTHTYYVVTGTTPVLVHNEADEACPIHGLNAVPRNRAECTCVEGQFKEPNEAVQNMIGEGEDVGQNLQDASRLRAKPGTPGIQVPQHGSGPVFGSQTGHTDVSCGAILATLCIAALAAKKRRGG